MDRVAVFVDAGYLFAAGSIALGGEKLKRSGIELDIDAAIKAFVEFATKETDLPLLRVYWYDGTSDGPTSQQAAIGKRPSVKVRLGLINSSGQQKGVDSLIITDLIALARNRAMASAVLLTGDEDIRVGVQQAQEFGVRVHLIGIAPVERNLSPYLLQEADALSVWEKKQVESFMKIRAPRVEKIVAAPALNPVVPVAEPARVPVLVGALERAGPTAETVVTQVIAQLSIEQIAVVASVGHPTNVPADVDRRLLGTAKAVFGRILEKDELKELRRRFMTSCVERHNAQK
jgi:uncharacterized LabA/DUF88 family protein